MGIFKLKGFYNGLKTFESFLFKMCKVKLR